MSLLFHWATIWIELSGFLERNGSAIVQISPLLAIRMLVLMNLFLVEGAHAQVHANVLVLWTPTVSHQQTSRWTSRPQPLAHQAILLETYHI